LRGWARRATDPAESRLATALREIEGMGTRPNSLHPQRRKSTRSAWRHQGGRACLPLPRYHEELTI
jgi:hypothetical protein